MTIAQASAFYVQRAGMSPAAATVEAVKNSMFPGAALMYFVGRDAIHELRDEIQATLGSDFNLRSFHDALLSCGSVPVSIAGEAMRSVVRTTRRLPSGPLLEAVPPAPVHDGRHS
jgi:uncharacterized protein (DUF885 family)